ncbi:uncharacterized protein LOC121388192 [Gigantopelta aegis]|uniref:uncharacterized protein LOC121388192 n=1 Tax=Gigantopelta aegis TaxID=1735272 RepID=UPI001B88B1CB|nr:uncharacterized protein LOC121388192 [Gigantopelta aegis]
MTYTTSGHLLIGANRNRSGHFRGSVRCFVVFLGQFSGNATKLKDICEKNVSYPKASDINKESCVSDARKNTFTLKASSAAPAVGLNSVLKVKVTTKIQCAKLCLETLNCRSFTTKEHSGSVVCGLYDFETGESGLTADNRSKYFALT